MVSIWDLKLRLLYNVCYQSRSSTSNYGSNISWLLHLCLSVVLVFVHVCVCVCVFCYVCLCLNIFSQNFVPSLKRQLATSRWFGQCMVLRCLTERPLDLRSSSARMMSMASGNWTEKSSVHPPYVSLKYFSVDILLPVVQFAFIFTKPRRGFH